MKTLFIFRQDLRILDNTGLRNALQDSREVIPVFILDKNILKHFPAKDNRLGFLVEALQSLDQQLRDLGSRLYVYHGVAETIIPKLLKEHSCDAVYRNRSYGKWALTRDSAVRRWCRTQDIHCEEFSDFFLVEPEATKPYKVYTPFYNTWIKVVKEKYSNYELLTIKKIITPRFDHNNQKAYDLLDSGVNKYWPIDLGHERLQEFSFKSYNETRNTPSIDGSSKLSPYIRFGLLSVREVYKAMRAKARNAQWEEISSLETFVKELARREFWNHIAYHFPEAREIEFQEKRRYIKWEKNDERFTARAEGHTGYPLVDAWMRQLRKENRMHNRVRMVVASFLCKDLLIDWRLGEHEFAKYLLDYDSNVNMWNWQRSASVGADPKPLRIFNPLLQSKRFDPECEYIKKYIPELSNFSPKEIHDPLNNNLGYASPIIDHYERSKIAKWRYNDSKLLSEKWTTNNK